MTAKAVRITAKEEARMIDRQIDETIERRHNPEEKVFTLPPEQARIIQRIDEVVDWDSLTRRSIFDIAAQIYNIGYGDGFEAAKESVDDWLDRTDFCQGGH